MNNTGIAMAKLATTNPYNNHGMGCACVLCNQTRGLAKADDDGGSWITMNGTPVHLNSQGRADKGPAGIVARQNEAHDRKEMRGSLDKIHDGLMGQMKELDAHREEIVHERQTQGMNAKNDKELARVDRMLQQNYEARQGLIEHGNYYGSSPANREGLKKP